MQCYSVRLPARDKRAIWIVESPWFQVFSDLAWFAFSLSKDHINFRMNQCLVHYIPSKVEVNVYIVFGKITFLIRIQNPLTGVCFVLEKCE